jgi:hypothetical protein
MRILGGGNSDISVIENEPVMRDFVGYEGTDEARTMNPVRRRRSSGEWAEPNRNELESSVDQLARLGRSVDMERSRRSRTAAPEEIIGHDVRETHVVIGVEVREKHCGDLA